MLRVLLTSCVAIVLTLVGGPASGSMVTLRSSVDLNNLAGVPNGDSFTIFVDLSLDAGESLSALMAIVDFDALNFQAANSSPRCEHTRWVFRLFWSEFREGSYDGCAPGAGGPINGPSNDVFFSFDVTVNRLDGAPDTGFFSFGLGDRTDGVQYGPPLEYSFEQFRRRS